MLYRTGTILSDMQPMSLAISEKSNEHTKTNMSDDENSDDNFDFGYDDDQLTLKEDYSNGTLQNSSLIFEEKDGGNMLESLKLDDEQKVKLSKLKDKIETEQILSDSVDVREMVEESSFYEGLTYEQKDAMEPLFAKIFIS